MRRCIDASVHFHCSPIVTWCERSLLVAHRCPVAKASATVIARGAGPAFFKARGHSISVLPRRVEVEPGFERHCEA
jgi:hypothetical protein